MVQKAWAATPGIEPGCSRMGRDMLDGAVGGWSGQSKIFLCISSISWFNNATLQAYSSLFHLNFSTSPIMEKGDLTYRINGCAMSVHNKLHRGFMEYVYCRALAIELRRAGIQFEREVWLPIHFDKYRIAYRRCDFLCEGGVVIEAKAKKNLNNDDLSQAINTIECLNKSNGLLINFGAEKLEFKHIFNNKVKPESDFEDITPEMVGEVGDDIFTARHYLPEWLIQKMQQDRLKGKIKLDKKG